MLSNDQPNVASTFLFKLCRAYHSRAISSLTSVRLVRRIWSDIQLLTLIKNEATKLAASLHGDILFSM